MAKKDRIINYFDITPAYNLKGKLDIIDLFEHIDTLKTTKSETRFEVLGDKYLYVTDIKIIKELKQIEGKVFHIRKDAFPEILNTTDDKIRDVEATDDEGIVEKTHFILSYKKDLKVAFEHNQYGARISDFIYYLEKKGLVSGILSKVEYYPISRDSLTNYKNRIQRISSVIAKVHKEDIKRINEYDKELFSAFKTIEKVSYAEYITLELKYDYQKVVSGQPIKDTIDKIIRALGVKKLNPFTKLIVRAEDKSHGNILKDFDLLHLWYRSAIKAELKPKSRTLISTDVIDKMKIELNKEFGL